MLVVYRWRDITLANTIVIMISYPGFKCLKHAECSSKGDDSEWSSAVLSKLNWPKRQPSKY